jgi:hypothetical protein
MERERPLGRVEPFEPSSPVPRRRLIRWIVLGPLLWLVALCVVAITVHRTNAIGLGLLIASGSLVVSAVVLAFLRAARDRERERYGSS